MNSSLSQANLAMGSIDAPKEAESMPAMLYQTSVLPPCVNGPCATAHSNRSEHVNKISDSCTEKA